VSELSASSVGQAVRLQADQGAICSGNIAFHSSRMSLGLCKLILLENKFNRLTLNVCAVYIPRFLGARLWFVFGPFISRIDIYGTDLTE